MLWIQLNDFNLLPSAMCKIFIGVTMWVYYLYYEMIKIFSLIHPLTFSWTNDLSPTNHSTQIFRLVIFSISRTFECSPLIFLVTHYIHLVHFCYTLEVHVIWIKVDTDITPSRLSPNPWLIFSPLLSCVVYDVVFYGVYFYVICKIFLM